MDAVCTRMPSFLAGWLRRSQFRSAVDVDWADGVHGWKSSRISHGRSLSTHPLGGAHHDVDRGTRMHPGATSKLVEWVWPSSRLHRLKLVLRPTHGAHRTQPQHATRHLVPWSARTSRRLPNDRRDIQKLKRNIHEDTLEIHLDSDCTPRWRYDLVYHVHNKHYGSQLLVCSLPPIFTCHTNSYVELPVRKYQKCVRYCFCTSC